MNGLDLFSGIGGLGLALREWVQPIAYCENNRFCHAVLLSRMRNNQLRSAPIWDDIKTLRSTMLPRHGGVDIIYGGFPCQDLSIAGTGRGLAGDRSGLYWEIERLIKETNPLFVFLENVPAIRTRGLNAVVQSLTELGYDSRWTVVSAAEVGAVHIRKRWFLLAHANGLRLWEKQWAKLEESRVITGSLESNGKSSPREASGASSGAIKPRVDRTGDGVCFNVDRNRALGNSVVPVQAREAFKRLMGLKNSE